MNLPPTRGFDPSGQRDIRRVEITALILIMAKLTEEDENFFTPTIQKINTFIYIIEGLRGVNYESSAYSWGAYSPLIQGVFRYLMENGALRKRSKERNKYWITELTDKGEELLDGIDDRIAHTMHRMLRVFYSRFEGHVNMNYVSLFPFVISIIENNPRILGEEILTIVRLNGWHIPLRTFKFILRKSRRMVPKKRKPKWKN